VVLESSFSGETMASALGISPSKNIVRRHLITEFDSLILPSRYACLMSSIYRHALSDYTSFRFFAGKISRKAFAAGAVV
jgi:hypothetical protein